MAGRDALTAGDEAYDRVQQLLQSISETGGGGGGGGGGEHHRDQHGGGPRLAWPGLAPAAPARGAKGGARGGARGGRGAPEDGFQDALGTPSVLRTFEPSSTVPNESLRAADYEDEYEYDEEDAMAAQGESARGGMSALVARPEDMYEDSDGVDLSSTLQAPRADNADPALRLQERTHVEIALHSGKDEHVVLTDFVRAGALAAGPAKVYGQRETLLQSHLYWLERTRVLGGAVANEALSVRSTFDGQRRLDRDKLVRQLQERDTWLLMYMLVSGKVPSMSGDNISESSGDVLQFYQTQVDLEYADDEDLQRWDLVCRWLQLTSGADDRLAANHEVKRGKFRPNTVHALKTPSSAHHGRDLVARADPDADLRADSGNLPHLQADDEDDQVLLLERLWKLVRAGAFYTSSQTLGQKLDDFHFVDRERVLEALAEQACQEYGEPFRVASLSGGAIFTPEDEGPAETDESGVRMRLAGNPYRTVWKQTCVKLAARMRENAKRATGKQRQAALLEEAIYAVLGGDMQTTYESPLCQSWRVQCWFAFRCMVQARVDHVCIKHRELLEERVGHMRGPDFAGKADHEVFSRGVAPLALTADKVFENVADRVPDEETFFFRVQRALVEGNFNTLLMNSSGPESPSLCDYLCGEGWELAAQHFLNEVSGTSDLVARGLQLARRLDATDEEALESVSAAELVPPGPDPPCWKLEHRANAVQMLRFTTHAALFMAYSTSHLTVVSESQNLEARVPEALTLAYIRYLVGCPERPVDHFVAVPAFYPCFVTNPDDELTVTVQASLFEAAAAFSAKDRMALMHSWMDSVNPTYTLARGARQALRNVRRRWLTSTAAPSFIHEAVAQSLRENDDALDNHGGRIDEYDNPESASDARMHLRQVWRWLAMVPSFRLEAFVQANAIIRDFLFAWASNDKGGFRDIDMALSFLHDDVEPFLPHNLASAAAFRDDIIADGEGWVTLIMSPVSEANVATERSHLTAFLEIASKIWEWNHGMANIETGYGAAPLEGLVVMEILERASEIANLVQSLLEAPDGWLHPEENSPDHPRWPKTGERVAVIDHEPETVSEMDLRAHLYGRSKDDAGALRKRIIPWLVNTYMDVCSAAAQFTEDTEFLKRQVTIANLVADSELRIRQCFEKKELRRFLDRVRKAACDIILLEQGRPGQ